MKIRHLAIWAKDLEKMKTFYQKYFDGQPGNTYHNPDKNFRSCFLTFNKSCRLELMHKPDIPANKNNTEEQYTGLIHFAISVGSEKKVDELTKLLKNAGYKILGEPRRTGDGYYESVILDPEENRVEITA